MIYDVYIVNVLLAAYDMRTKQSTIVWVGIVYNVRAVLITP